jgi:hypothetical protein
MDVDGQSEGLIMGWSPDFSTLASSFLNYVYPGQIGSENNWE